MMKNTHYIGRYTYKDNVSEETVEVHCPAIIDEVTWNAVNMARRRQSNRALQKNATTTHFYLLRDFMICGHCGRKMSGRIKPAKNEYMYYCPNKERSWAKDGGSASPWERGTGCGFERSMNIPATDKLVFDTVVNLHKESSVLKEEIKKQIFNQKGIKTPPTEDEIKEIQKQLRKYERLFKALQESIGQLEANRYLRNMEDTAYKVAFSKMNEESDRLKGVLADLRLQLEGQTEKKQWVDWMSMFGEELDQKRKLTDAQRQQYLAGLIEKIECRFLPETRDHELTIHFNHPIVGDKIKWKDPKNKSLGYKVIQGSKETQLRAEKRDGRGK